MKYTPKKRGFLKTYLLFTIALLITLTGCSMPDKNDKKIDNKTQTAVVSTVNDKEYSLKETVILSRHNVRAPLSTKGSDLYKLTPHEWINWSSDASELSLLGGNLETLMGQYFRKYLVEKGLMAENEQPNKDSVRFYSNSMQRTIATAQYFSSGFLPIANIDVEYHNEIGTMDSVFNPQLTFMNKEFEKIALAEIAEMGGEKGLQGIEESLKEDYQLLADVLDLKESEKAKKEGYTEFPTDDLDIKLQLNKEPSMSGSLRVAAIAVDALVLQYYESTEIEKTAFGKELSYEQWESIAHISNMYSKVLFTAPSIAKNIAHPLLKELKGELTNNERRFSFLCGHDSNIASTLAALGVEQYELPNAIEKTTPIGVKLVMEKWEDKNSEEYITFKLIYLSVDQLRNLQVIDLTNPPMIYDLSLKGINKNKDGMYALNDVMGRFDEAISSYDRLKEL